ncbi:acetyl-CoA sensor PanZ family protein [Halomonas sp. E14]|uniref:acetyl-CoA sensor PanZ family protein n=1 Tax=Halomonas sp. E14 TaxID=3397245 RepID=UPI00403E614E
MPVTLQFVDHSRWACESQVQHDLKRIYDDAPAERLPLPAGAFIETWLQAGRRFGCAHFNDRLIGAVAIATDDQAWWLSHFCIRKATRRRGVGSRLLALIGDAAREEGRTLRVSVAELPLADQLLLSRLGYRLHAADDYFELRPPL